MTERTKSTLVEFLLENDVDEHELFDVDKSPLVRLCMPFVGQCLEHLTSGRMLIRGMGRLNVDNVIKNVVRNRRPVDTPIAMHTMLDDSFQRHFGHAYRSNAVFASSNASQTYYGHRYAVFPIGKYSAVYSTTINDLYDAITSGFSDRISQPNGISDEECLDILKMELSDKEITALMDEAAHHPSGLLIRRAYTARGLLSTIIADNSGGEGDIGYDSIGSTKINHLISLAIDRIIAFNYIKTSDLSSYLQNSSTHPEVMIQCNSYLAINVEHPAARKRLQNFLEELENVNLSRGNDSSTDGHTPSDGTIVAP